VEVNPYGELVVKKMRYHGIAPSKVWCDGGILPGFWTNGIVRSGEVHDQTPGVCLLIVALSLGRISVVTPLSGTAPLFVLLLTSLFLRDVEVLTARILAGTLLIVAGVILLTAFERGSD